MSNQARRKKNRRKQKKQEQTVWKTGTKIEVLPGTVQAMSGPREPIAPADEVELFPVEEYRKAMKR